MLDIMICDMATSHIVCYSIYIYTALKVNNCWSQYGNRIPSSDSFSIAWGRKRFKFEVRWNAATILSQPNRAGWGVMQPVHDQNFIIVGSHDVLSLDCADWNLHRRNTIRSETWEPLIRRYLHFLPDNKCNGEENNGIGLANRTSGCCSFGIRGKNDQSQTADNSNKCSMLNSSWRSLTEFFRMKLGVK